MSGQATASDTDLVVDVSPKGDVIYKIDEPLDSENWVVFVSLMNRSKQRLPIERIAYTISAKGAVVSEMTDVVPALELAPNESRKMPLRFFRERRDRNVDELAIEVQGKGALVKRVVSLGRYEQKIKLRLPLKGVWVVGSAHDFGVSHRRWNNRAHFAWDFLKVDSEGRTTTKDVKDPKNHYAFGEPVIAPADGVVLKVQDGFPDHPVGEESAEANGVFLDLGGDLIAYFAHLRKGSILVKEGEKVKVGQKLAEVGNSGQSNLPHLHFHVQKLDRGAQDPLKPGIPMPVSISDYDTIGANGAWSHVDLGRPVSGDFLKASTTPAQP